MTKGSYTCPKCGCFLPKKEAKVSGWDSQSSLKHVHCPKCGKIITNTPYFFKDLVSVCSLLSIGSIEPKR